MRDGGTAGYLDDFRARGEAIAEACTRCGACFRACPMIAPAGLGDADPEETAAGIIGLTTGGAGTAAAVSWASVCSGSGNCIPACPEGIDTRFMVQLARGFARARGFHLIPENGNIAACGVMLTTSRSLNFPESHASVGRD